jgi:hypothetical protein
LEPASDLCSLATLLAREATHAEDALRGRTAADDLGRRTVEPCIAGEMLPTATGMHRAAVYARRNVWRSSVEWGLTDAGMGK